MRPDRSLRVAVVTETYPPEVNGVSTTIARVVEGLLARGHEIELVRPRRDANDAPACADRLQEMLVRGLAIPRYAQLRMGLPARGRLVDRWTRQRPDLVHIATEGPLGWSALRAALQLGLPTTSDFRTNFHAYSRHYGIGWLQQPIVGYLRRFHNRTGCTMVPTEALRRELEADGFERTVVVARGVDSQGFGPQWRSEGLRRSWGAVPGDTVVLCVGRLAPEKNLGLLLEAFAAMRAASPSLRLVFVGDGPLRPTLQARCPDAVFAGLRSGADLAAHYASGDLFLFPSLTETFGNVTPEAMASGLPVLAYDYAAAAQLVRAGENGLLAPFDDHRAFVRQAVALVTDPAAARTMGLAARQTALGMDWVRIVRQIEAVMRSVLPDGVARSPSAVLGDWGRLDIELPL